MKCKLLGGELVLEPEDGAEEYFLIQFAIAGVVVSDLEKTDDGDHLVKLMIGRRKE